MRFSAQPLRSLLLAVLLACAAGGQSQTPVTAAATIDAGYVWEPSSARGPVTSLGFLQDVGRLRLIEATLSLNGDWDRVGFHIDGGTGDFYRMAMAGDSVQGPNRYISQAYVFGKPFADLPLRIEAGKFFSSVGAEAPQGYLDFNASRSLLFWYGSPLYHVGLRASMPVTSRFTAGVQLLSGCNTITGAHGHQSAALTAAWTAKRWSWTQLYMGGNEKPQGRGWRHLSDTVFTFHPTEAIAAYAELLAAAEKRPASGYDRWYGLALASRFSLHKNWAFSPRVEWFADPDGATTGTPQRLHELTLTAEYRPAKFAIARLEYRTDWSNRPFHPPCQTLIAGLTLLLSRGF